MAELILAFLISAAAAQPPGVPSAAETRREFLEICQAIRRTADPTFGAAQLLELQSRLGQEGLTPAEKVDLQARLAHHLLRLGETKQALALFNETLELASESRLPKRLQIALLARTGVAALRLGEVTNCVDMHGPAMCVLPIADAGRHRDPQGSLLAMKAFEGVLDGAPDYPLVPWLLNIAAMTVGRYPEGVDERYRVPESRMSSAYDIGRFSEVAHEAGLHINDLSGGAVMDDFDGDGDLDVVTSSAEPCTPLRFFANDGQGRFENRSESSGLTAQLGGLNLVHADYDNDGDLDLFILRGGWLAGEGRMRNSLMENDGAGRFSDVTARAGLAEPAYPTQTAAWADSDLDGDLDLFVGNEGVTVDDTFPSQLFRNDGPGADGVVTFTDVAAQAGVTNGRYAKGVAWGDYDNDGDPDLYVSNFAPNRLYRNDGAGDSGAATFTDVAPSLELVEPASQSFGTWFFDYDNDGHLDIFVASYAAGPDVIADYFLQGRPSEWHPRIYHNLGDGRFRETSAELGVTQPSAPMGLNYGDLDNDGFPDFYLGTGWPQYEALMPNLMYWNDGGRRFVDVTYSGGFGHLQKGHGVAFGDLDGDGDQDVFEQMGGAFPGDAYPSCLYRNPGHGNAWLTLRLEGVRANRSAIGARITVTVADVEGSRRIHHLAGAGGSFGASSLRAEIGLGKARAVEKVEIVWPAGSTQRLGPLAPNRVYTVREGRAPREGLRRQ